MTSADRPPRPSRRSRRTRPPAPARQPAAARRQPYSSARPPDRAAAHRAYHDAVDRAYAAYQENPAAATRGRAGDADHNSWPEALPSLRAAWEEHQKRYPERERLTPQTHTDGSWSCGDTRRLSPDQNAEATKACADIQDEGKRAILPTMRQIEAADPDRRLAGLEHMLKGADRLKGKIAEQLRYHPDLAPRQAAAEVPDAVRFTLAYSEAQYTDGVPAGCRTSEGRGLRTPEVEEPVGEGPVQGHQQPVAPAGDGACASRSSSTRPTAGKPRN